MAALAALFAGLRARFVHLVLLGVFLHAPIALLAGNTARMEPLLLAAVCGAVLCIARGHAWAGLALLAGVPLVHPNGAFFALGGGLYFLQRLVVCPEQRRISVRRLAWLGLPLALWVAYAAYVAQHWESFLGDMAFQLTFKRFLDFTSGGYLARLQQWEVLVPAFATGITGAYAAWRRLPLAPLFALAVSGQVLIVMAMGWMYEVYLALAQLLVAVACVEMTLDVATLRARGRRRVPGLAAAVAGLLLAVGLGRVLTQGPLALTSVEYSTVYPERIDGVPYLDETDQRAVRAYLESLGRSGRDLTVHFLPWSDALLFHDLDRPGLRFQQPTFHERRSDVCILHESRWISDHLRESSLLIAIHGEGVTRDRLQEIHSRDGTERWLVFRRDPAGTTAPSPDPEGERGRAPLHEGALSRPRRRSARDRPSRPACGARRPAR
jgi:hypothetical protein